jgi:hypothetical protein
MTYSRRKKTRHGFKDDFIAFTDNVRKCQRGNQKPYIEGQTIQWSKQKAQTMIYKTLHRKLKIE